MPDLKLLNQNSDYYFISLFMTAFFTCLYLYLFSLAGYGNFTFRMDFYHNAAFETPYTEKDYPIGISLNEYLYVKYSVESTADLVIMAENCKATKDGSYHSWPQYNIIQNG